MGANAQTTVPTFTASQVLTADQMNQSARTGVPVFATTVTRDAAFGGTGEKTLAEGQMCYIEGTGFQTYNGTSWVTWGAAPSAGALVLVKSQTIGSGVSTVAVTSAFSATYDAYRIVVSGGAGSTSLNMRMQLGATTTGYYDMVSIIDPAAPSTPLSNGTSNGTLFARIGAASADGIQVSIDVVNPFLSKRTFFYGGYSFGTTSIGLAAGFQNSTTSFTDFTLSPSTGTLTGGEIRVYGLALS